MSDIGNSVMSEEELQEKLTSIYNMLGKTTYDKISEEYGISKTALVDLKDMSKDEFEKFINSIEYVKGELKEGKSVRKIAAKIGCGSSILSFMVRETISDRENINKKEVEYAIQRKKVETLWKQYKQGEDIKKLALKHNMTGEDLKELIDSFDRSLTNKRRAYMFMLKNSEEKEERAKKLKEKYGFDDDTIAYLLYGKEFENLNQKEGASLDEL